MSNYSVALLIYGEPGSGKNAFTEEKYSGLAAYFVEKGFDVQSVCYHDSLAGTLTAELTKYDAVLVWVNPVEQQNDRTVLDALLKQLSAQGCFVSAHPDTILRIGTKEILFKVKSEEFGTDVKLYPSFEDFKERFLRSVDSSGIRILKQYRGNGGKGVFKVDTTEINQNRITITSATQGDQELTMSIDDFYASFQTYFQSGSLLIDQEWKPNIVNGMVRCYLCGGKVAGFGYQEVNALYPKTNSAYKKPGKRFYFSEDCGLFSDLKQIMEARWVQRLQEITELESKMLPVIWDADFFINEINTETTGKKYSLCEINVSSVSPFPESAIPYIVEEVKNRIKL
jgi:hypothetical protein